MRTISPDTAWRYPIHRRYESNGGEGIFAQGTPRAKAQERPLPPSIPAKVGVSLQGGHRTKGHRKIARDGKPLVSIITVVRNGVPLLDKTIASILNQTYDNIEYVVIDGGSTDGTLEILRDNEGAIDYWLSEPDGGVYEAMNKGLEHCSGDLIGIIGAGDWYEEVAVERAVGVFLRTRCEVVYGDVEVMDAESGVSHFRTSSSELMPKTMSSISHPTVFAKRSVYVPRLFDTRFRIAADYDLFLGRYKAGCYFEHSGGLTTHIRTGGVSGSLLTLVEVFLVHRKYYGAPYALRRFIQSASWRVFYESRRLALRLLLPPSTYRTLRTWWLRKGH